MEMPRVPLLLTYPTPPPARCPAPRPRPLSRSPSRAHTLTRRRLQPVPAPPTPPWVPAYAPSACAAAHQRGCLARGWLVWAAWGGTGARGHQKALGPLFAAAPAQPLRALRPPGAAQLAQQTLRHHLVEARPVLLGDEDPAGDDGRVGARPPTVSRSLQTAAQRRLPVGAALRSGLPGTKPFASQSPSWCPDLRPNRLGSHKGCGTRLPPPSPLLWPLGDLNTPKARPGPGPYRGCLPFCSLSSTPSSHALVPDGPAPARDPHHPPSPSPSPGDQAGENKPPSALVRLPQAPSHSQSCLLLPPALSTAAYSECARTTTSSPASLAFPHTVVTA